MLRCPRSTDCVRVWCAVENVLQRERTTHRSDSVLCGDYAQARGALDRTVKRTASMRFQVVVLRRRWIGESAGQHPDPLGGLALSAWLLHAY